MSNSIIFYFFKLLSLIWKYAFSWLHHLNIKCTYPQPSKAPKFTKLWQGISYFFYVCNISKWFLLPEYIFKLMIPPVIEAAHSMLKGVAFFLSRYIARSANNSCRICTFFVLFEFSAKLHVDQITGYFYFIVRQYANKMDVIVIYFTKPDFQKIHCCLLKNKWRFFNQKRKETKLKRTR